MSYFHLVAVLPGDARKTVLNKTEAEAMAGFVIPFVETSTITTKWGPKVQRRQALELRVYRTDTPYDKKQGIPFDQFIKGRRNVFGTLAKRAKSQRGPTTRVFVVMPLQGEKYGTQDEQRILKEYDERFDAMEVALGELDCYAIRIDKEAPLEGIVDRIKEEIRKANFVIADLTDERPSCYFEAGYAEALGKPVIYVASKESVVSPATPTAIHFDIHKNINFFTNHKELKEKIRITFNKNRSKLLAQPPETATVEAAA
jgi:nucleoside 2-deoxyribosyltransferase